MRKRQPRKILLTIVLVPLCVLFTGLVLPQRFHMPVEGAGPRSFDLRSFWYYPWGASVTHKGVDIFAPAGTPVHASVPGLVVFAGENGRGGNAVLVLGPKWRLHYYAHLREIRTHRGAFVGRSDVLGTVGNSGNAKHRPAHLHYSMATLLPYPWHVARGPHGLRRMWYLDPTPLLVRATAITAPPGPERAPVAARPRNPRPRRLC